MPSKYPPFDRSQLRLLPLADRCHDMDLSRLLQLGGRPEPFDDANLSTVAKAVRKAKDAGKPVILLMGAHVINQGLSR